MPLLVKLMNDTTTYVTKDVFNDLIADEKILVFKRPGSHEWVDPRIGPMRGKGSLDAYTGPERRARF